MNHPVKSPRKLIEVALPLDAINVAAAREKSIRHGHPSTLHLWWARRPLAAARAVIFAQMVNDPGYQQGGGFKYGKNKKEAAEERERLFRIMEELVKWENTNNEEVLEQARAEIRRSWREVCELNREHPQAAELFNPDKLPGLHDPFAGGGTIPLEAQRLGLEAYASDLNPVAVTINKAMIEIPPKFAGHPPVHPEARREWLGDSNALSRTDGMAQGYGPGQGNLSAGTDAAEGRDLRNAVANHEGSGIRSSEHCRRLDSGIRQGEGALSGDCTGITRGDRNVSDTLRRDRLVSDRKDTCSPGLTDRSGQDADNPTPKVPIRTLTPNSSPLFPRTWEGAQGLAEDVRRYGAWMREEAQKRIGHLYPPVEVTAEMAEDRPDLKPYVGQKLTVIAWLWARTVKSPNPAFSHVDVPLASTFVLSKKEGKEAYVEPVIEGDCYRFTVKMGKPTKMAEAGTSAGKRAAFNCLMSDSPIDYNHIRAEGKAGRMGEKLMAVVAEGVRGRVYLAPTDEMERIALQAQPNWKPEIEMPLKHRNFQPPGYGMTTFGDLFTSRQLVALTTFSDLVSEAIAKVRADALASGMEDDGRGLEAGGKGATAYGEAVGVYLGFAHSRATDRGSTICSWDCSPKMEALRNTFGRQAIPMTWDFAEGNPFSESSGNWTNNIEFESKVIDSFSPGFFGYAIQDDAQKQKISIRKIISTDPPYYDNIAYADLSDFFYVWLRRTLRPIYPSLFATLAVPKAEELVAAPYRHGGKEQAENFFLEGMTKALANLAQQAHPVFPVTIYYAFKQSESSKEGSTSSTGWETFLEAVMKAGFALTGTWPMRTELGNRMIGSGNNVLASSIVLVCQKRSQDAPTTSRREFQRELNTVLPEALDEMTKGSADGRSPVAPVDLSQAIIGPGMAVFSKYSAVLEADGTPMSVKTALQLINRFLAEDDFDHDTQFCLHWFEQYGWKTGVFGEADVLARAKATSVEGLKDAGVVEAGGGQVRLLKWSEYPSDWNPAQDVRLPVWEALHHLIRALRQGGESAAGSISAAIPGKSEAVRQLAYRLYTLCERQNWAEDARAYNELITSWSGIESSALEVGSKQPLQRGLFD